MQIRNSKCKCPPFGGNLNIRCAPGLQGVPGPVGEPMEGPRIASKFWPGCQPRNPDIRVRLASSGQKSLLHRRLKIGKVRAALRDIGP